MTSSWSRSAQALDDEGLSLAAFSVGANLGDLEAALEHALDRLSSAPGYELAAVSSCYETTPVGGPDQPDYLNLVVVLAAVDGPAVAESAERARSLLALCHSIERDFDRVRDVRWGPRTLDVDILAVGSYVSADPRLTVPHPRLAERAFVLVPWAEVAGQMLVPGLGPVAELESSLTDAERDSVRRIAP